jgi:hypothetical protein
MKLVDLHVLLLLLTTLGLVRLVDASTNGQHSLLVVVPNGTLEGNFREKVFTTTAYAYSDSSLEDMTLLNSEVRVAQRSRKIINGDETFIITDKGVAVLNGSNRISYSSIYCITTTSDTVLYMEHLIITCTGSNSVTIIPKNDGLVSTTLNLASALTAPAVTYYDELVFYFMSANGLVYQIPGQATNPPFYTNTEIDQKFGPCSGQWSVRSYNSSHFILECPRETRCLLAATIKDVFYCNISAEDNFTIFKSIDKAVVIYNETSFILYQFGFRNSCRLTLNSSLLRVDYGIIDDSVVLIIMGHDKVWLYDTTKSCDITNVIHLANGSFPCFNGLCDGYFITADGYLLLVSNISNNYSLDLYDVDSMSFIRHWNISALPNLINVVIVPSQVTTPSPSTVITPFTTAGIISSELSFHYTTSSSSTVPSSSSLYVSPSNDDPTTNNFIWMIVMGGVLAVVLGFIIAALLLSLIGIFLFRRRRKKLTKPIESTDDHELNISSQAINHKVAMESGDDISHTTTYLSTQHDDVVHGVP